MRQNWYTDGMEGSPQQSSNTLEIKRSAYLNLINDFGFLISFNALKLDEQIERTAENEAVLNEMKQAFRKPIINGKTYGEFISEYATTLTKPQISSALLQQIYNFLTYIEPRLFIFKAESPWVERFRQIKESYRSIVAPSN